MAKLTENQKLGIVAGVAVLLAGLGGGGVWWAKGLVQEKADAVAGMRTEIEQAVDKIRKIPKVEQDVIVLRENLYEYIKILPEETELNDFLRTTQKFQAQSKVAVQQFTPGRGGRAGKGSPFERYTYRFQFNATIWQFMEFMNLFEGYERFVQVKEFALNSGSSRTTMSSQDVVHRITMTVETYAYKPGAESKDVAIANYATKVEKLREEIFEAKTNIAREGYRFQGERGRRDIFIDPREAAGKTTREGTLNPNQQRQVITTMAEKISECKRIFERLQDPNITIFERYALERTLRQLIVQVEGEVNEINDRGTISHAPLRLTWSREVVEPLARLKSAAIDKSGPDGQRGIPIAEMQGLLERMKDDLKSGDIRAAVERYDIVSDRLEDVATTDQRYKVYLAIEGLYLRAKLAEEFSGLPLNISGIAVNAEGRSGVVLNGSVYEEGEYIDNNLLVKSVERDRVEFVYKGFTVVKIL